MMQHPQPWRGDTSLGADDVLHLITPPGRPPLTPTDEQRDIVQSPLAPLLVVAGAGAGKTATMSMRVLWAIANKGVAPDAILGLTFSRKAAGEMGTKFRADVERLRDGLGVDIDGEPVTSTYNSFAQRIVREHGLHIGLDPEMRLVGAARSVEMMTSIVTNWRDDLPGDKTPSVLVRMALNLAGHLSEHEMTPESGREALRLFGEELREAGGEYPSFKEYIAANDMRIAILDFIDAYQQQKKDAGLIDYSDQLFLATRIVREVPDVAAQLRAEHEMVLLDEFQDTSVIQMELLSRIFHDHPVTAVGDPHQAIYGWRGASASSLETFLSRFCTQHPPTPEQTRTLSIAWRNDRRILVAANAVAAPLRQHANRALSPVLRSRPDAGTGDIVFSYTPHRGDQVEAVADFIESRRVHSGGAWPTAAVLCRRRRDFPEIERALRERGIPTQVLDLGGLLTQAAVSDVRAALEIALAVDASNWLLRLLSARDIGGSDLALLWKWARQGAEDSTRPILMDAIDSPPPIGWSAPGVEGSFSRAAHMRIEILGRQLRHVRAGLGRSIPEQVERAARILGVRSDLLADPLPTSGLEALDAFLDVAITYDNDNPEPTLRGFLAWLAAAEEEENGLPMPIGEPDPHAVQILTVHAAKGLEWDCVAVVSLSDSIFPKHSSPRYTVSWREAPVADSGWLKKADELPYPLRGDRADLPPLTPDWPDGDLKAAIEAYHDQIATSSRATVSGSAKKYVDQVIRPALGAHHEREERRLAYVALTRARHHMLLAGSWYEEGTSTHHPSRYLMEARAALIDLLDPQAPTPPSMDDATRAAAIGEASTDERQVMVDEYRTAVGEVPPDDEPENAHIDAQQAHFPPEPGPSRRLVDGAARAVRQAQDSLPHDVDPLAAIRALGDDPLIDDTCALVLESRLRAEKNAIIDLPVERLAATSLDHLLADPQAFAVEIRRPMPKEPSSSASLGTILHAWLERQMRMTSGELWDTPVPGEDILDSHSAKRLAQMKENFHSLNLFGCVPIAVEEPFSVTIGGIDIQGRIDAVLRQDNGRHLVVDWKSGRLPSQGTPVEDLIYYLRQLRLYSLAWAQRIGVEEGEVDALVAFLSGPQVYTIEDLESLVGGKDRRHISQVVQQVFH
ncbi:MAG: ATP-dependent DNA helicase [Actinomycetaceae bacterium]|nr:ATP-dependent DNA helicase [Actinomycetaceae bacterium]